MRKLQQSIDNLAEELLHCNDRCAGIWLDRDAGILPRSLYLERPEAEGRGCFAVGLNPGAASEEEKGTYRSRGVTLENIKSFRKKIEGKPYFNRTRSIINGLGLSGPILWSNLAKCQNAENHEGLPPLQTLRHCVGRFLRKELAEAPPKWAVLGIGWEAYRALAYLVPERTVIGIPHPTGGFRDYRKMLDKKDNLRDQIEKRALRVLHASEPGAVWLGAEKAGA